MWQIIERRGSGENMLTDRLSDSQSVGGRLFSHQTPKPKSEEQTVLGLGYYFKCKHQ